MNKIVILASGGGSNARKIAEYFQDKNDVEISLIACNKEGVGVWDVAKDFSIDTYLITRSNFSDQDGLLKVIKEINPKLIVLAGFLWKIPQELIKAYPNSIINIHPALLPKFGGKGMYGKKVHEAVKDSGEEYTGITIHYVNEDYDKGHIIFQKIIPITELDTAESIESRIHKLEHDNFSMVVDFLLRNDY